MSSKDEKLTDPYGRLQFAIGSGDDFVCFDYAVMPGNWVRLHAVLNSETGSFIQDFEEPVDVRFAEAVEEALRLTDQALDWCFENDVRHTVRGWNQDPYYFARCVERFVKGTTRPAGRKTKRIPTTTSPERGPQ